MIDATLETRPAPLDTTARPAEDNLECAKLVFIILMMFDHFGLSIGGYTAAIAHLASRGCLPFFSLSVGIHLARRRPGTPKRYLIKLCAIGLLSQIPFHGLVHDTFMMNALFTLATGVLMAWPLLRWPGWRGALASAALGALYLPIFNHFDGGLVAYAIPIVMLMKNDLFLRAIPPIALTSVQLLIVDHRFGILFAATLIAFIPMLAICRTIPMRRLPPALWYTAYPTSLVLPWAIWGPWNLG